MQDKVVGWIDCKFIIYFIKNHPIAKNRTVEYPMIFFNIFAAKRQRKLFSCVKQFAIAMLERKIFNTELIFVCIGSAK